jgi:hypothetical protein
MAEPSRAVQFLMQEPVSMMDWGLKNIEDHLYRNRAVLTENETSWFAKEPSITVDYLWEKNTIQISITLHTTEKTQQTSKRMFDIRSHIKLMVTFLRGTLTMKPYDAFFRHKGFRSKESPEDLSGELSEMTELIVSVRDGDSNILSRCKASLLGSRVEWMKIGEK